VCPPTFVTGSPHTARTQCQPEIRIGVSFLGRMADGPSVVHLIDFVARQRQLLLTVTVLARGENDAQFKWDSPAVENAAGSSAEGSRASKRSSDGIGKSRESERRFEASPHRQEPETSISCCAEENCGSSASSVGEVEGSTPQKVNGFGSRFPQFHSQIFCFYAENRIDTNQTTI
jgi:hypothetical protein